MLESSTTTLIAIWGAVVSTVLAVIRVREHFRDRPDVRVQFLPTVIRPLDSAGTECCEILAVNTGRRPVTIAALVLQLSDGGTLNPAKLECYSRDDLPATLTESQSLSAFLRKSEIDMQKVQWAFARDVGGNVYKSKRFRAST